MSGHAGKRLSYCAEEVRRHDHDRFLTCLFAPAARREALFALYAFNLEVAKTPELVSEPMLGHIRLQWWRECLEGIYEGTPRRHPVAEALAEAIASCRLDRAPFERLLDARASDLEGEPPADLAALEAYAEATSGDLTLLALQALAAPADPGAEIQAAGRHVGIAWALLGLVRAVPFHARQKRLYLPRALCEEAGLDVAGLFELRSSPALATVARRLAGTAEAHLAAARRQARVPRRLRAALLPAVLARQDLRWLARAGYDPFAPRLAGRGAGSILALWAAARMGLA